MNSNFCQLWLTCEGQGEANKITNTLLVKHLIACAKQLPVKANYHWQGKIENNQEILLIMESRLDLFEEIEREIAKIHSYDTFVLEATPLAKVSKEARIWLNKEI